jgi:hypothetical protein
MVKLRVSFLLLVLFLALAQGKKKHVKIPSKSSSIGDNSIDGNGNGYGVVPSGQDNNVNNDDYNVEPQKQGKSKKKLRSDSELEIANLPNNMVASDGNGTGTGTENENNATITISPQDEFLPSGPSTFTVTSSEVGSRKLKLFYSALFLRIFTCFVGYFSFRLVGLGKNYPGVKDMNGKIPKHPVTALIYKFQMKEHNFQPFPCVFIDPIWNFRMILIISLRKKKR